MICQEASRQGFLTDQLFCANQNLVSDYCPEIEIVLGCTRAKVNHQKLERIKILLQGNVDWIKLIQYANKHGITQLLYHNIRQINNGILSRDVLEYLKCFCHNNTLRNLRLTHELTSLVELFLAQGITVIPFKGPVLSSLAYGNLALRQFGDLDLLVQTQDVEQARALLLSKGYQLGYLTKAQKRDLTFHGGETVFINKTSQTVVDLHWEITPHFFPFEISVKDWWKRLQPIPLNKTQVLTFGLEDTLLYLCVHAANHLWTRLEWLCDIAELIRTHRFQINWRTLLTQAKQVGCDRILLLNCCLIQDLLDVQLPNVITRKIALDPTLQPLLKIIKSFIVCQPQQLQPFDRIEGLLVFIRMRERPIHRLMHLMYVMHRSGWITPSRQDRAVVALPSIFTFLYWLIRPVRVFQKYRLARRQLMAP